MSLFAIGYIVGAVLAWRPLFRFFVKEFSYSYVDWEDLALSTFCATFGCVLWPFALVALAWKTIRELLEGKFENAPEAVAKIIGGDTDKSVFKRQQR